MVARPFGDLFRRQIRMKELPLAPGEELRLGAGRSRGVAGADLVGRDRLGTTSGPELQQLHVPVVGDEDVRGFKVPVDQAAPVNSPDRISQLESMSSRRSPDRPFRRLRCRARAFEELANDERLTVLFARFVHANVRVRNERRDPRLVMKPVDRAGAGHLLRSQQLDRDLAIEPQIARRDRSRSRRPGRWAEEVRSVNAHGLNVSAGAGPPVRLYFSAAYSARAATEAEVASADFHICERVS